MGRERSCRDCKHFIMYYKDVARFLKTARCDCKKCFLTAAEKKRFPFEDGCGKAGAC